MFPAPSFKNSSFIIHALVVGILSVAILSCGGGGGSSNQSPQANAGTDRSAMELSVVNLSGAASSDKDGVINQYLWEQVSPSAPMVTIASANNSSASFTAPDVATATDFQFRLTVTDDAGATNSDTVTIRVTNSLPSATATADAEVYSGETFEMSAATNLGWLYHWEQVSGPSVNLSNPNAADVSVIAPVLLELTPISFRLTVSDAEGNSDDDLVQLNIVRKNPTAIARAGIDRRGATSPAPALDVANVFLNAATSTGLNFSWSVVDMPAGAVYRFTSPNDLVTGFLADVEGDYTLSLAVDNGQGSSHSDSVMVTMLADVDGDGLRDSEDLDLDGDGFVNTEDAFPNDKASHLDTDMNGIGNYYHSDEDGDTVPDIMDDFPLDASKSALTLFSEAKETDVLFNRNDGISVAENAGTAPLSISGFIRAASQSPDLDYYKLTLNAGVFTLVMDEVQGGLKPTVNLVTASGARLATLSQNATGMSTSAYSVTLVPSDGDYYLIIGDSSGSSGDDWLYRIRIQADSDRDGIADDVEMALDINHLTSDSDGDGVNDLIELTLAKQEGGTYWDMDSDGLPMWWDTDSDGDSISDAMEFISAVDFPTWSPEQIAHLNDSDGDGLANLIDLDSDGNGVNDVDEVGLNPHEPLDTDGDGIADFIDLDNDNDGLLDVDESLANMNSPLGLGRSGSVLAYAERLQIVTVTNQTLGLESTCRAGDNLTVTGNNFPSNKSSLWAVFNWNGGSTATVPLSLVNGVATLSCPVDVGNGLLELFLATAEERSDSVAVQALQVNTPQLTEASYNVNTSFVTLTGSNLNSLLSVQLNKASGSVDNTYGNSTQVSMAVPLGAESGYVSISSSNGESNSVWLSIERPVTGSVSLPGSGIDVTDLDLGLIDVITPNSQGDFALTLASTGVQTVTALLEMPGSTEQSPHYASFLSAVVLPDEDVVPLSASTTALSLIWQGLGVDQLVAPVYLSTVKQSLAGLTEVISFANALQQALAADPYALNAANPVFKTENDAALLASAQWLSNYLITPKTYTAEVTPDQVNDISVYEDGTEGNVTVENDTQLYLSVKITASDGEVLLPHITGLNGMVGPQGYGLIFWASTVAYNHPKGRNATVEVITAGIDREYAPQRMADLSVWSKLFFRTWVERVIWPVIGEYLSSINAADLTNIIMVNAPAMVDIVTTKVIAGDLKGAMGAFLDVLHQDLFSLPPGPIATAIAKKIGAKWGETILKKIAAKIGAKFVPGVGQISAAIDIAGHLNNGINAVKAVSDVAVTDSVIDFEVMFHVELDSVEPTKVKADEKPHQFILNGRGFTKVKRGTWPFNTYLSPEITFTDDDGNEYSANPDFTSNDGKTMRVTVPAWFFDEEDLAGPISVEVHHPTDDYAATTELEDAIAVVDTLEITSLSPNQGGTGEIVTIYGSGFNSAIGLNEAKVGGQVALITSVSNGSLTIVIPDGLAEGDHTVMARVKQDGVWSDWAGPLTYKVVASSVNIVVCDNGGLKDDAFALYVDGAYMGTMYASNSDYCDTYTPTLANGSHSAILIGVEAPDSVGTYSIRFSGVSGVTGSSTSGSDLTPGVRKLYSFNVDVTASPMSLTPKTIVPSLQQMMQSLSERIE